MQKTPAFKPADISKFGELEDEYADAFVKLLDQADQKKYFRLRNLIENFQGTKEEEKILYTKINSLLYKAQSDERAINVSHEFWLKNASSLGLNYDTNYSYLK